MAVVQTFAGLQRINGRPPAPSPYASSSPPAGEPARGSGLDTACGATYAAIYRTQPHVRTVVDFLARNIAQIAVHVYRRVSDTDRVRLVDHALADWLARPNPDTTGYRLRETLMQDLGIYGIAYWLKVRLSTRIGLVRLAPDSITPLGWLIPTGYVWTKPDGSQVELGPADVVTFRYFHPDDPLVGLSPLETLRHLLAEDAAAGSFRRAYWGNAAQLEGVITRPATAPKWTTDQKQSFREQWTGRYAGRPGQTAVLEDGMTFTPTSFSARDSELTASRKLTREEVAAAYHVPLPMVGILDHATFSNIREQHKNLYQDCLGPSLEMIQQEIERQLLPECRDTDRVYVEANIAEKLKGSFEEQADALRSSVGRPYMTANEGRARLNLPAIKNDPGADALALPLNMSGAGEPADTLPSNGGDALAPVIQATWERQRARLDKLDAAERPAAFDVARWDRELAADLESVYLRMGAPPVDAAHTAAALARTINADTLQLLVREHDAFTPAREAALYVTSH